MSATSRTYLSALERARQSPTLDKLEDIADDIGVHPLTLLIYAYTAGLSEQQIAAEKLRIQHELEEITRYDFS